MKNNPSIMIRNNNNISVKKATMRIAASCLLLFFLAGNLKAQVPGQYVIKYNDTIWRDNTDHDLGYVRIEYHYLTRKYNESSGAWELKDTTNFSPACIWISDQTFSPGGANKNYYFYDQTNQPRFLTAPNFTAGGALAISTTTPTATDLNTPEYQYYFYRWDNGLGRGVQYYGVNENTCLHEWRYGECWEVYWVAYEEASGTWKLSDEHYGVVETHNTEDPEPRGARYSFVEIVEHSQDTTPTSGGLADLEGFEMVFGAGSHALSNPVNPNYQYSYTLEYTTYTFEGNIHNYYGNEDHGTTTPGGGSGSANSVTSYRWTLSGDGADYLSFDPDENVWVSTSGTPTVYYRTENTTGNKIALLTLTVTYNDNSKQHRTAEITVKTPCQNPGLISNPVVTYTDVTVSWYPTATSYRVYWKKNDPNVTGWSSADVGNVTSYVITGLDFGTPFIYKVQATSCDMPFPSASGTFTTMAEPEGSVLFGAIFGGGRMANVGGKTEVVIVNCESIGAIYGGNDIAGTVQNTEGSKITLGVDDDGVQNGGYDDLYGTSDPTKTIRIGSVYGGGNGYYSYGSTDFAPIGASATTASVGAGASVYALSKMGEWNVPVWTNETGEAVSLTVPSITKTKIVVTNNCVKTDSIFGGAKNAFLTASTGNGSDITIDGGTHLAVFGGNNVGGSQGDAKQYIEVNKTTINLVPSIENSATEGYGRDFGIRYLFGGGNKVLASGTDVLIQGGQLDTIFAGGNSADVAAAQLTVNCSLGADAGTVDATGASNPSGAHLIFGDTYTNAIKNDNNQYTSGSFGNNAIDTVNYNFDGFSGIYNVRTLFGGNNKADMHIMPEVTLTSGSVGTVYGGGNAGDMLYQHTGGLIPFPDDPNLNNLVFDYSTHVVLNSNAILVDYLYGGCQMSNVLYSTWVELQEGHVGTVYGGCNISGDVGSTRVNPSAPYIPQSLDDQAVYGSTYVKAGGYTTTGGDIKNIVVYKNLYAGSNGYYDCSSDGIHYNSDNYYDDPTGKYEGLTVPTHNETHAVISAGARVRENVYAGGNLACVGFDDGQGTYEGRVFPELVGMASVRMDGGRVEKNVYGGCNMSNIYGTNEVRVSGGYIGFALYGGNDRSGQVAEKTNRFLPDEYIHASDDYTSLTDLGVKTYVGVKGSPQIGTVYGGGNGAYDEGEVQYCSENFEPIQSYTFVDIHINGGANGGHIGTVYGGGNGVTVRHGVTVFLNINEPNVPEDFNNVDTIFGGNNKGDLDVVSDILLVHGQVGTVYGGCNRGAMVADGINTVAFGNYNNIGSYVRLMETYDPDGDPEHLATVTARVTEAIYGGCRMNDVDNSSLVLVEHGDFSGIPIFGGCDISGHIGGWSRVVNGVLNSSDAYIGGTVGDVYGGGNGDYYYVEDSEGKFTVYKDAAHTQQLATGIIGAPSCTNSGVDLWSGQVGIDASNTGNVFGGGFGALTETTNNVIVNVGPVSATSWTGLPVIYGDVYGGSALGNVNTLASSTNLYSTYVNFLNGTLHGNLYGGGKGDSENADLAKTFGAILVSISNGSQLQENCYIDLRDANVFGCNNTNGSPQNNVTVDVWKTAYNFSDYTTGQKYTSQYIAPSGETPSYAIHQVFGGGNHADYAPMNGENIDLNKKTNVIIHDCLNTIYRVFSGGNAAAASKVAATIEGGRMDYVFGGGNGEVDPANIGAGGTNLSVEAGIIEHLFGGSNLKGYIAGPVNTIINGDHYVPAGEGVTNPCNEDITEFFGGSNQASLQNNVTSLIECGSGSFDEIYGGSKLADIVGDVTLTIRGGTCTNQNAGVFGGSRGRAGNSDDDAADITGNVTLNLEGGNIYNAFGGSNINGNITGNIVVNVIDMGGTCGLDLTNVYGGGNVTPYIPTAGNSSVVNVIHIAQTDGIKGNVFGGAKGATATVTANPRVNFGYDATSMSSYVTGLNVPDSPRAYVTGNVFGGGDLAPVNGSTMVNVYKGDILHKLVGGGNQANVSGNANVNISGGRLCTATDINNVGIYGGCNTSGTVGGNVVLNITGTAATQTTIGVEQVVTDTKTPVNVHGGGYGQGTSVSGNVTVNYGSLSDPESEYPKLFGDLYGGSALGNVNTNGSNSTTVNLLNGSIISVNESVTIPGQTHQVTYYYSGNIFGGGLGKKAEGDNPAIPALVKGKVYVNIGKTNNAPSSDLEGKITLIGCNVYGCNNTNGSPQDDVKVDVYQTAHTAANTVSGNDYAILRVFGGGNEAHYAPENGNVNSHKKTNVYVHACENTIKYLYGGGNAADAVGVVTVIEGGRFDEVYGGGNGLITPANIGSGSIGFIILAGHVNFLYEGSNKQGIIGGTPYQATPESGFIDCGELYVDSYFFGDNEAEHIGDIVNTITCDQAEEFNYKYVYAGSRWAIVYGDIKLTVRGGNIKYLYGGSKGYLTDNIPADVRRYPTAQDTIAFPDKYSREVKDFIKANPSYMGKGGNIELIVQGGTIGEVMGGCDELGNVEGKITVIIDGDPESEHCPLFVGNVYGASNRTNYTPTNSNYVPTNANALPSPNVSVLKGVIGGKTKFNTDTPPHDTIFAGNVFGGGNLGHATSNPKVIIGDGSADNALTVKGDVYGGGNVGNIQGSPQVVVVPLTHTLAVGTPTGGSIKVRNVESSGTTRYVGEGNDIPIEAVAAIPTTSSGYIFDSWTVTGTGANVSNTASSSSVFTMGTTNATLNANFTVVSAHQLTMQAENPAEASGFVVYGASYTGPVWVTESSSVTVTAIPANGYAFTGWTIDETAENAGASLRTPSAATTTFTMGTTDATLTAHFERVYTLTLEADPDGACTFKVNGSNYTAPVSLTAGTTVTVQAIPAEGQTFSGWTYSGTGANVGDTTVQTTTFTMGTANAMMTAHYGRGRRTNNNRNSDR